MFTAPPLTTNQFSKVVDLVPQEAGQPKVVGPLYLLSKGDFPNLHTAQVAKGISVVGVVVALMLPGGVGDGRGCGKGRGVRGGEGLVEGKEEEGD